MSPAWHAALAAARRAPLPEGRRSAQIMRHGSMELRYYAPHGDDPQTPHERDELYVVASGRGAMLRGEDRVSIGPNDVIFVPARTAHRFVEFSDDFAVWVIFYGPQGGERDNPFAAG